MTLLFFSFMSVTSAQDKVEIPENENPIMKAFTDSLNQLRASYYAHFRVWEDLDIPVPRNIRPNSDFYKLFVPPTYYHAPVKQAFEIDWKPGKKLDMTMMDSLLMAKPATIPTFKVPQIGTSVATDRWVNQLLLNYYMQYPDRVKGNEMYLEGMKVYDESHLPDVSKKEDLKTYMKNEGPAGGNVQSETDLVVVKPNFWKKTGSGKIQFTQHSVSDNWYKGGESTNALYSELILSAKYDDKQRIQFENELEVKLGFITAPSDTIHEYKTNSDLLRLNSKLGIKAFKDWYYTLSAELKTQMFPNYKTNSNDLVSGFMSPFQLKVSLGMDYKLKKKNFDLSILGAPLTYKYVYLKDKDIINPSAFEVEQGKSSANLFGSEFKIDMNWKIAKNIEWRSKLEYFTTYEKVNISWENTFDFKLNRYLSTSIFIHPRFDDGVTLSEDNNTYFQFKEMLTFGLSYTW